MVLGCATVDLDDVTADQLAPVYVLVSADVLLLERAVARVRELAVPEAARAFNYDVIDGRGATAARVLAAAQTLPMMARRRLVYLRDLGAMSADEIGGLTAYLDDPNPSTVLLAVAAKADKRMKFFAAAKKQGYLMELAPPRNVTAWVREEASRRRVRIAPAAAARLADVVGRDLARLALAVEQLALYAGDRPVTADDVDDLVADTRERTVFELTDAIGEGDRRRALTALAALFEQRQSPIGVVLMLARHVRQLAIASSALRDRLSKADVARELGLPPFIADKLVAQARRFAPEALDRALARLAETDFQLKGGAPMIKTLGRELGERVLLDRLVGELLAAASRPERGAGAGAR
jgi:DNA polymerase-3 subunit delta